MRRATLSSLTILPKRRRHTEATSNAVLLAVSLAIDNNNPAELSALIRIQTEYEGLVEDLAAVSVPKTFAPLYLQSLNSLGAVAASVEDLQKILNDPLRGLQALKQYQSKLGEVGRVFTSIAEALGKNGILFNNPHSSPVCAACRSRMVFLFPRGRYRALCHRHLWRRHE